MSDLAVGTGAGQIKIGSLRASSTVAKYQNLQSLIDRLKSGCYRAPFGFRSGRNAQEALRVIHHGILGQGTRWLLEVEVRKYFGSIDHAKLRELPCTLSAARSQNCPSLQLTVGQAASKISTLRAFRRFGLCAREWS
jgi:hypothetical protein